MPAIRCTSLRIALAALAFVSLAACTDRTDASSDVAGATPAATDTAPAREPQASLPDSGWTVSARGVHGARIGGSAVAARAALGLAPVAVPGGDCTYLDATTLPVALLFMTERDSLVRIDVRDSTVTTAEGARIGDTEARINSLYAGRVTTTPHKYTGPAGHYLTVAIPGDTASLIVFETDGRHVTTFRVGRKPAVQYVEGCS